MNKTTTFCCAGALLAAATLTAKADLTFSTSGTTTSWLGTPDYASILSANLGTATVAQGNPALGTGSTGFVLSETFTPSSSFTLGSIGILGGVSAANTTLSLHLYNVTGVDKQASSAFYFPGTDLLGNGSGLSFTVASTGEAQYIFSFSNGSTLDQVALTSGQTYALEIWTPQAVGQNNFQWYRAGVVDTQGQMMGSGDPSGSVSRNTIAALGLAGGSPHTASVAVYGVPEPTAMALLGIGALVGTFRLRRQSK